jgi:spermidine/putrescine transport system substrate-binding protein
MAERQTDPAVDEIARRIAGTMSRRRLLQAAGIGGAAMLATACGAGGGADDAGGGSGSPAPAPSAEDLSDTDKTLLWSTWPLYIDVDDETGERPTLKAFEEQNGITVTYTEDVNDNNEFYAKVRAQLEQGQPIDRDLVVLTDWMAALWIQNGYAQLLDKALIPNSTNLIPRLQNVSFDPNRDYTLPWQSGFGGLGYNINALKDATGKSEIKTVDELWDPGLKGRVTVLSEMRDTMGILIASQGNDPTNFTDDQFNQAIDLLTQQVDSGQIRQVTGNDYIAALENGDVIAVIGWSGDVFALGDKYGFNLPESGGTLWTDNMLVPALAAHKKNAELAMNYYYEPAVAAKVAEYVQYICPVEGAQAEMEKIDPELASSPYIFPTDAELSNSYVFMELTPEQQEQYERAFQKAIGN